MAHWSSGQDASLSRWKLGFDSRMGHQNKKDTRRVSFFVFAIVGIEHAHAEIKVKISAKS